MFATFITVALFAAASVKNVAAYNLATPQLTQCQEATITWDGAQGSVNLIAVPASDVCNGKILADLGDHDGKSATWKVDVPAGTKLVLTTLDSADVEAWSGEITVNASDDNSCVRDEFKNAASSSSSSSSASSESTSASSSSGGAGTYVASSTYGAASSFTTPDSGSSSSSNSNSGITNQGGPVGGVASDPLSKNGALTHATKPMLILGAISAVLAASM